MYMKEQLRSMMAQSTVVQDGQLITFVMVIIESIVETRNVFCILLQDIR